MTKNDRNHTIRKGDIWLIGLVAVLAILGSIYFFGSSGKTDKNVVVIYQDGELLQKIPLDEDTEFVIEGAYTNKLSVKDGKAFMEESNCPGNDCVLMGEIHEAGPSIVCLPNKVEIRIEGQSELDAIAR